MPSTTHGAPAKGALRALKSPPLLAQGRSSHGRARLLDTWASCVCGLLTIPAQVTIKSDTTLTDVTGGLASRTMLASDWFDALPSLNERQVKQSNLWTCIVVADTPPREFGFKEFRH